MIEYKAFISNRSTKQSDIEKWLDDKARLGFRLISSNMSSDNTGLNTLVIIVARTTEELPEDETEDLMI